MSRTKLIQYMPPATKLQLWESLRPVGRIYNVSHKVIHCLSAPKNDHFLLGQASTALLTLGQAVAKILHVGRAGSGAWSGSGTV